MEKICGIYCIKNIYNGKIYIGQSININERIRKHKEMLNRMQHHNYYLQNDWSNYPKEYFLFDILQVCKKDELEELEKYYVKIFRDVAYNQTNGGEISYTRTEENKKNIQIKSTTRKEVYQIDIFGNIINKFLSIYDATKNTPDLKGSISRCCNNLCGFTLNGYTYRFVKDYEEERYLEDVDNLILLINNSVLTPVVQIDIFTNEVIKIHNKLVDACNFNNYNNIDSFSNTILSCCNHKSKVAYNYKWIYFTEYLKNDLKYNESKYNSFKSSKVNISIIRDNIIIKNFYSISEAMKYFNCGYKKIKKYLDENNNIDYDVITELASLLDEKI